MDVPQGMHIESTPQEPGERELSPREKVMAEIVAKAEARRQAEMDDAAAMERDGNADTVETTPYEPSSEPVQTVTAHDAPLTPPSAASPPETPRVYTIDGMQLTEDQLLQLGRLGMVANVALHQTQYQQPVPQQPAQYVAPQQSAPLVSPDRIRDTVRHLQYSGEDQAVEALAQLVTDVASRAVQVQPVDPNAIVQRAVTESQRAAQLMQDTNTIRQEYPEIFSDPQRMMLAKLNVDAIRSRDIQTGRVRSDIDIYREAGDAVYNALGRSRSGIDNTQQQAQALQVPVRQNVIEQKRAAPRQPSAVGIRAPAPPMPPSEADARKAAVAYIMKQRGQTPVH